MSVFPKGMWTNLTPYDCLQVFLDETDSKFCQSIQNAMNNCLFKPYLCFECIFCSKHLSIKHGYQSYNFGYIDKIRSHSHLKYTVNLTFQYIQSRFVAMMNQKILAKETAVVL